MANPVYGSLVGLDDLSSVLESPSSFHQQSSDKQLDNSVSHARINQEESHLNRLSPSTDGWTQDLQDHQRLSIETNDAKRKCCKCRTDLIGVKCFYLTFIGALGCVLPYVNVFLKQVGLSPEQIGLISGFRPVVGFLSAPLWGSLADRFDVRRLLLFVSLAAWLACYAGLYYIKPPERISKCPDVLFPNRHHIRVRRSHIGSHNGTESSLGPDKSYNLSSSDLEILREDQGWSFTDGSLNRVFITAFIVIIGGEFFQAPTIALCDVGTLETLGGQGILRYGEQRAWGAIGWAASSLIGGGIVSKTRRDMNICGVPLVVGDYGHLVYVFAAFMALAFICAGTIKFKRKRVQKTPVAVVNGFCATSQLPPGIHHVTFDQQPTLPSSEKHTALGVLKLFWTLQHGSWLVTIFFAGTCSGLIWGFLYWHLDNLGGTQLLMGLAGVASSATEFLAFLCMGYILRRVSLTTMVALALLGYAVRFCIYAGVQNPWWVLPAEMLQGVTFTIMVSTMTIYSTFISPSVSLATTIGITHGTFFGLGNGLGHLIGGLMVGRFGAVITFYSFSVCCGLILLFYLLAQKFSKGRRIDINYTDLDRIDR